MITSTSFTAARLARGEGDLRAPRIRRRLNAASPAPPVLEFDAEGNMVKAWGGPGQGYEWPESNHGITPDSKGNLWIGGNGAQRRPHPEVHARRQVRQAVRLRATRAPAATTCGRSARSRRSRSTRANNEAYVVRRLRQQARRGHRHGHRQDQALLGRVRQQAGRHEPGPLQSRARRPPSSSAIRSTAPSRRRTASSTSAIVRTIASRCSRRTASS